MLATTFLLSTSQQVNSKKCYLSSQLTIQLDRALVKGKRFFLSFCINYLVLLSSTYWKFQDARNITKYTRRRVEEPWTLRQTFSDRKLNWQYIASSFQRRTMAALLTASKAARPVQGNGTVIYFATRNHNGSGAPTVYALILATQRSKPAIEGIISLTNEMITTHKCSLLLCQV